MQLRLGNTRNISRHKTPPKQSVLLVPFLAEVHRNLYKRVRSSFVTLCRLSPLLSLTCAFVLPQSHRKDAHIARTTLVFQDQYSKSALTRSNLQRAHDPQRCKAGERKLKLSFLRFIVCCHTLCPARTHTHTQLWPPFTRSSPLTRLYPRARTHCSHTHTHT